MPEEKKADQIKVSMIDRISDLVTKNPQSLFRFELANHDAFVAKILTVGKDWLEVHPHKRAILSVNVAHILSFRDVTGDSGFHWRDWTEGREEKNIVQT